MLGKQITAVDGYKTFASYPAGSENDLSSFLRAAKEIIEKLSVKEREIFELVCLRINNQEIAEQLYF